MESVCEAGIQTELFQEFVESPTGRESSGMARAWANPEQPSAYFWGNAQWDSLCSRRLWGAAARPRRSR